MTDGGRGEGRRKGRWRWVGRVVFLLAGGATLYVLAPQVLDVWAQAPEIQTIGWVGLAAMVVLEACSFVSSWWLHRIAMPGLTWLRPGRPV